VALAGLLVGSACLGCGSSTPVVGNVAESRQHLQAICDAYLEATKKLGRPPSRLDDIVPYLKKHGDPAVFLKSPEDGEDYQIFWNLDLKSMRPDAEMRFPVVAFEKHGKSGKRYVLTGHYIRQMTDEEFHKALFPPGFTPT
jgi:hypothetical protein